jgi:hypothetical protein
VTSFVEEPHAAVCCDARGDTLNLVATESGDARTRSVELSREKPEVTLDALRHVSASLRKGLPLLEMPARHPLFPEMDVASTRLHQTLLATYEQPPDDFTALLARPGVGPKTLRALALASELIYGAPASTRDPARFSFAHGGKDGTPFPVDRETYDGTIDILQRALNRASVDRSEKVAAFKRLTAFSPPLA